MLLQSDGAEAVPADRAQWLYSVAKREPSREDFLIAGAATSVCQQCRTDSWRRKPRRLGVDLRSATGHQFTTTGNTTICLRTRDGVIVAGDFQIAPKYTGLERSIISVGQVCDRGNIITFRSTGEKTLNEFTGKRIEFERAGGVYRLSADTRAKTKSESGGVKVLMGFEQDTACAAEAQPARPGNVPVLPSEAGVEQHELTHLPFRHWCRHCVRAKGKESPHHESSPGGLSNFATVRLFMGDDGTPITTQADYDGLKKHSLLTLYLAKARVMAQRVVHKSSESDTAERPRTEHHRRQTQSQHTHPNRNRVRRKPQLET